MHQTQASKSNCRTVQAHSAAAVVQPGGTIHLTDVPFPAGTAVEVLVLEGEVPRPSAEGSLRGTVLKDVDPFGPAVPPGDWDANR